MRVLRAFAIGYIALSFWHRDPLSFWFGVKALFLGLFIVSLFERHGR